MRRERTVCSHGRQQRRKHLPVDDVEGGGTQREQIVICLVGGRSRRRSLRSGAHNILYSNTLKVSACVF